VLQGPGEEEVVEGFELAPARAAPVEAGEDLPQVLGAGPFLPAAIVGDRADIYAELGGQALHRRLRGAAQVVGHETEPRQSAELEGEPEPVRRPPMLPPQPGQVLSLQAEERDQVVVVDLGRISRQPGQLGVGEKPGGHGFPPRACHRGEVAAP
jgi:hypothetical protein